MQRAKAAQGGSQPETKVPTALKVLLVERGLSQRRIARALGISESRLSRVVCGRVRPRWRREALPIARFLGADATSLFPRPRRHQDRLRSEGDGAAMHVARK